MTYLAASGVCLAAIVGSLIYENHRMKKEEASIRKSLSSLAE